VVRREVLSLFYTSEGGKRRVLSLVYTSLVQPGTSLLPCMPPSQPLFVGSPPSRHARRRAHYGHIGSQNEPWLAESARLAGGPQGLGLTSKDPQKGPKEEKPGRNGQLPPVLWAFRAGLTVLSRKDPPRS